MTMAAVDLAASVKQARKAYGFEEIMRVARAIRAEMRARRAAHRVNALSDAMLHDIGLTRGEIDGAVRTGRTSR